jgi:flagellar hook assembly protein FlgD
LADLPSEFALLGNYPNPFNASTVISYELPTDTHVKVEVYNISGQKVATVVDGQQEAGYRSVLWDASGTSSGIYLYKLTAGDYTEIKTMTLLR